jgi:hypothetical protein
MNRVPITSQVWLRDDLAGIINACDWRASRQQGEYGQGFADALVAVETAIGIEHDFIETVPRRPTLTGWEDITSGGLSGVFGAFK